MITTTLAYFPSPAQGVWYLGPVPIRAYAVCIIIGIVAALLIGDRRWAARGGERGVIYDIALWAVPFGLVGGRLYHVMTDWKTYFGPDGAGPIAALRIWDGGLGIWGAVALGGVGAWIACRRRGIPLPAFGDAVAPGIVLAQAIGRLGNYFNQELYGRETTVPWGMEIFYRRDPSGIVDVHSLAGVSTGQVAAVVHPTFLYELLWNLLVFVVLILIDRRFKIGHGRLFALYVALYCVGRFGVELLRDDFATHIDGIRINSFTATFVFLGAVVYVILAKKGREDPQTLGGHEEFDEDVDEDVDEDNVSELAQELVAAAAGTGVVAAATIAGREDGEYESDDLTEVADELEAADEFEPLDESDEIDETDEVDETDEAGDVDEDVDDDNVPELAQELVVALAGTGVVAAATVAGREDGEYESDDLIEVADELEAADEFEPLDESDETDEIDEPDDVDETDDVDATDEPDDVDKIDDVDAVAAEIVAESSDDGQDESEAEDESEAQGESEAEDEDESIVEAVLASAGVEIEDGADAEDDLIDEDHDPVDEDYLEGLFDGDVTSAAVSEQEESLESADEDAEPEESAELAESAEIVSELAAADSSEMVILYASDPVDDGIVLVRSEDDAAEAPTVVYEADDDSAVDIEPVEVDSVDVATDEAEADEHEAAVEADQNDLDDSADVDADTETAESATDSVEGEAEPVGGSRLRRLFRRNRP